MPWGSSSPAMVCFICCYAARAPPAPVSVPTSTPMLLPSASLPVQVQSSKDPEGLRVFYYLVQVGALMVVVVVVAADVAEGTASLGDCVVGSEGPVAVPLLVAMPLRLQLGLPVVLVAAPALHPMAPAATAPVWRNVGRPGRP